MKARENEILGSAGFGGAVKWTQSARQCGWPRRSSQVRVSSDGGSKPSASLGPEILWLLQVTQQQRC